MLVSNLFILLLTKPGVMIKTAIVLKLSLCLFFISFFDSNCVSQLIVNAGFEDSDMFQGKTFSKSSLCNGPDDGVVSDSFARSGNHSARFEVRTTDALCGGSFRAELSSRAVPGLDFWTAYSEYTPEWLDLDNTRECHMQMHDAGRRGSPLWGVNIDGGRWKFGINYDTMDIGKQTQATYDLGPVEKGVWTDWVIYSKFRLDPSGEIKVWKNGVLVTDINGSNYNKENGGYQALPYLKFGIYKWVWHKPDFKTDVPLKRVVYIDDVKMADSTATIDDFLYTEQRIH